MVWCPGEKIFVDLMYWYGWANCGKMDKATELKVNELMLKMEEREKERRHDFEIMAFVKVENRILTFWIKPMRCLTQFVNCIVKPIYVTDRKAITVTSLRWIAFHKCINRQEPTMEKNPEYLLSYSVKSNFFDKRTRQIDESYKNDFK